MSNEPIYDYVKRGTVERLTAENSGYAICNRNITAERDQLKRALETAQRSVDDWRVAWEETQTKLMEAWAHRDALRAALERIEQMPYSVNGDVDDILDLILGAARVALKWCYPMEPDDGGEGA